MKLKLSILLLFAFFIAFFACKNGEKEGLSKEEKIILSQKGQEIATATFAALGGALKNAMQEGGVPKAIDYCNLNAMPIVDSLSKVHGATIRRTSLRLRNSSNTPTEKEKNILTQYEAFDKKGEQLQPIVQQISEKKVAFYAPIRVNAFCLQCHGTVGEELTDEDYTLIKSKYPKDEAINFKNGALRGMWSIELPQTK